MSSIAILRRFINGPPRSRRAEVVKEGSVLMQHELFSSVFLADGYAHCSRFWFGCAAIFQVHVLNLDVYPISFTIIVVSYMSVSVRNICFVKWLLQSYQLSLLIRSLLAHHPRSYTRYRYRSRSFLCPFVSICTCSSNACLYSFIGIQAANSQLHAIYFTGLKVDEKAKSSAIRRPAFGNITGSC